MIKAYLEYIGYCLRDIVIVVCTGMLLGIILYLVNLKFQLSEDLQLTIKSCFSFIAQCYIGYLLAARASKNKYLSASLTSVLLFLVLYLFVFGMDYLLDVAIQPFDVIGILMNLLLFQIGIAIYFIHQKFWPKT